MKLINWCNENVGFISLLLSLLTLIVSILAIFISIKTAQLPYRKKLLLTVNNYDAPGFHGYGILVSVTNIGNRTIFIKKIGLLLNNDYFTDYSMTPECTGWIKQGEEKSIAFSNEYITQDFCDNPNTMIYGFIEDSEGKKYKNFLCKYKDLEI